LCWFILHSEHVDWSHEHHVNDLIFKLNKLIIEDHVKQSFFFFEWGARKLNQTKLITLRMKTIGRTEKLSNKIPIYSNTYNIINPTVEGLHKKNE